MEKIAEIEYLDFETNEEYEKVINKVLKECFFVSITIIWIVLYCCSYVLNENELIDVKDITFICGFIS